MTVGSAQIRAARALLNWSQDELAVASGTSRRSVYAVEKGVKPVEPRTIDALVRAFKKAGVTFLTEDGKIGLMAPDKGE